jgi:hypothetical protein
MYAISDAARPLQRTHRKRRTVESVVERPLSDKLTVW